MIRSFLEAGGRSSGQEIPKFLRN